MYLRFNPVKVLTLFMLHSLGNHAESAMGEWGPWGSWSQCSRTCGLGVASQSRRCYPSYSSSDRMSSNCLGLYKQFKTCNPQPCPTGGLSFRAKQCAEHNNKEFRGRKFQWQPHTSGQGGQCQLVCRAKRYRYYAVLADKVVDGTPCDEDLPGRICVNGKCESVGCDGVIGSEAKEDGCGVCKGDNSSCHIISGIFTRTELPYGYNKVTSIPHGACNINITEMFPSRNYLAMKIGHHGKYMINGNWVLGSSGEFPAAGTVFTYHRPLPGAGSHLKEYISAPGPLNTSVVIEVLKQEQNQGVTYSYTIPTNKGHHHHHKRHHSSSEKSASRDEPASSNSLVSQADYVSQQRAGEEPQKDASDPNARNRNYLDQLRRSSPTTSNRHSQSQYGSDRNSLSSSSREQSSRQGQSSARGSSTASARSSSEDSYQERMKAYYARVEAERERRRRLRQLEIDRRQREYDARVRQREEQIQRRYDVQASSNNQDTNTDNNNPKTSDTSRASSDRSRGNSYQPSRTQTAPQEKPAAVNQAASSSRQRSPEPEVAQPVVVDNKPKYSSKTRPGPNYGIQQGGNQPRPGPNVAKQEDTRSTSQKSRPGPNFGIQQGGVGNQPRPGPNLAQQEDTRSQKSRPGPNFGIQQQPAPARGPRPGPNYGIRQQSPGVVQPGLVQPGVVQPGVRPGLLQPGVGLVQPGGVQPGIVQPGILQPGILQPGIVQPGIVQPGIVQQGVQPAIVPAVGGGQRVIIPAVQQPYPQYQQSQPYPNIGGRPNYNQAYGGQQALQGSYQVRGQSQSYNPNYGNNYYQKQGTRPINDQISLNLPSSSQGQQLGTLNSGGEFSWTISGFTECSRSCGGGTQETLIVCVKTDTQAIVTDENCDNNIKPKITGIPCNNNACPPGWHTDEWSECSTSCDPGVQTRKVECKQRVSDKIQIAVSADQCVGQQRPEKVQYCNEDTPCVKWRLGEWSECSADCGRGQRTREVVCINVADQPIPENSCSSAKPKNSEICDMGSCAKTWFYTDWSEECSSECGSGYHTRDLFCSDTPERCRRIHRPHGKKHCRNETPCGGKWFIGPWTKCSVTCGEGVIRRDVACVKSLPGGLLTVVGEENCLASEKAPSEEPCQRLPCKPQWYMTDWTQCSQSCNTGYQTREVKCLDSAQGVSLDCEPGERPETRQPCNTEPCLGRSPGSRYGDSRASHALPAHKNPRCRDSLDRCHLVVQARLCSFSFYNNKCCASCATHAHHHPHDS